MARFSRLVKFGDIAPSMLPCTGAASTRTIDVAQASRSAIRGVAIIVNKPGGSNAEKGGKRKVPFQPAVGNGPYIRSR